MRVAFYDQGVGSWELYYRNAGGQFIRAAHVRKTNSLEFVELRVKVPNLGCCLGDNVPAIVLVDSDAHPSPQGWTSTDTDIFAWVEVMRSPFLYQLAEKVLEQEEA